MIRIRLLSCPKPDWSDPRIEFNPAFSEQECDGLLAWGEMQPEFLKYDGVRAWFHDEPRTNSMWLTPLTKKALRQVQLYEFLHHSNPDPRYRFPCATHYRTPTIAHQPVRKDTAIAVVNNYGGRFWWIRDAVASIRQNGPGKVWLRRGINLRNRFILHPAVELFGDPGHWKFFRQWPWSKPRLPPNYKGAHPAGWLSEKHIAILAQYRIAVCLENASLPYYFTEKLVNAVRAGCVPVYHAHSTVRNTRLQGAFWIDPADYEFDPSATFDAARKCNADDVREQNWKWLHSDQVRETEGFTIWSRVADYFVARIQGADRSLQFSGVGDQWSGKPGLR
jgi:hypothetical protein